MLLSRSSDCNCAREYRCAYSRFSSTTSRTDYRYDHHLIKMYCALFLCLAIVALSSDCINEIQESNRVAVKCVLLCDTISVSGTLSANGTISFEMIDKLQWDRYVEDFGFVYLFAGTSRDIYHLEDVPVKKSTDIFYFMMHGVDLVMDIEFSCTTETLKTTHEEDSLLIWIGVLLDLLTFATIVSIITFTVWLRWGELSNELGINNCID